MAVTLPPSVAPPASIVSGKISNDVSTISKSDPVTSTMQGQRSDDTLTSKLVEARKIVNDTLTSLTHELHTLNRSIHSNPEVGFEEHHAHSTITTFLRKHGFTVTTAAYNLPTAFEATIGETGPLIIFCAEYDALPTIGHACGHNLIATSSLAAFIAASTALIRLSIPARIRILGTPAEEGGGGKVVLLDSGAFSDPALLAALMAHPIPSHTYAPTYTGLAGLKLIACHKLRVEFRGKTAHAGAEPWAGVNALDAAVAAYTSVSMLRQQMRPEDRVHGVFEDGGTVPNVIPGYARLNYYVRAPTIARADELLGRVKECFEGAARAAGCEVSYSYAPTYKDLRANNTLCSLYVDEMAHLGQAIKLIEDKPSTASTDMGNISYHCPTFHGGFAVACKDDKVGCHHPDFAEAAGTDAAHDAAIEVGKGMAMLGLRVLLDKSVSRDAWRDFKEE